MAPSIVKTQIAPSDRMARVAGTRQPWVGKTIMTPSKISMTSRGASYPPSGGEKAQHPPPPLARPYDLQRSSSLPSARPRSKRAPRTKLSHLEATLALRRARYGEWHPSVGKLWNRVGTEYFRACQYDIALAAYTKALRCEAVEEDDDDDHNDDALAITYANIGTVYWVTGRVPQAIGFLRQALNVYELHELSDGRNPETNMMRANVSYQLGLALTLDAQYEPAYEVLKKTQRLQEAILGKSSLSVGRTVDALGKVFFFQGNLIEALKYHNMALRIKEYVSDDPTTIATSLLNIAAVYSKGRYVMDAFAAYERALQLQKEELARCTRGNRKAQQCQVRTAIEVGETLQLMSQLCRQLQQEPEAQRYAREAVLVYQEARLTCTDPRLATLLNGKE